MCEKIERKTLPVFKICNKSVPSPKRVIFFYFSISDVGTIVISEESARFCDIKKKNLDEDY